MGFLRVIIWEYVQNLPIVASFAWALDLWQQRSPWLAILCVAAGAAATSILIALTERKKVSGHREPPAVLLANIATIFMIVLAIVVYLSAPWSTWLTDLVIGALGGVELGVVQSLAAREKVGVRHCLALGLAGSMLLVLVRLLLRTGWPVWANGLTLSVLATLVISLIDYTPRRSDAAARR
jgi:hypothetical protein